MWYSRYLCFLVWHQSFCSEHWSIAVYDIPSNLCYYANSIRGFHGEIRNVIQKIVHCIELIIMESDLVSRIRNRRVIVSPQYDGISCGWRVCLNAALLLKSIFEIQDPLDIATYTDLQLDEFRVSFTPRLVYCYPRSCGRRGCNGTNMGATTSWTGTKKRGGEWCCLSNIPKGKRII